MTTALILPLLLSVLGSSVVGAVISALFGRRKMNADTAEIINRTAGEQIDRLRGDIGRLDAQIGALRQEKDALERKVNQLERRELSQRDLMQTHAGWDWRVMQALRKHLTREQLEEEEIYPPPPLYPPT